MPSCLHCKRRHNTQTEGGRRGTLSQSQREEEREGRRRTVKRTRADVFPTFESPTRRILKSGSLSSSLSPFVEQHRDDERRRRRGGQEMGRRGQRRGKGKGGLRQHNKRRQQAPQLASSQQKKRGEERRSRFVTHGVEMRRKTEGFAEDRQTRDTPTANTHKGAQQTRSRGRRRVSDGRKS